MTDFLLFGHSFSCCNSQSCISLGPSYFTFFFFPEEKNLWIWKILYTDEDSIFEYSVNTAA